MRWLVLVEILLVYSGGVAGFMSWYAWRQRATRGSLHFSLMLAAVALYAVTVSFELASVSVEAKIFWSKVQYFASTTMATFWIFFALHYGRFDSWLNRRRAALFWIVPAGVLLCAWTNEWHRLVWRDVYLIAGSHGRLVVYEHGPVFWCQAVYSYALLIAGATLLLLRARQSARFYRSQVLALLFAMIAPIVGNLTYLSGVFQGFDLAPLIFTVSSVPFAWAVFRFNLLKVIPIAHDAIVAGMRDGVVLIDLRGRLVEINRAAESMLSLSPDQIGLPAAAALERWPQLAQLDDGVIELPARDSAQAQRWYEASASPLHDDRGEAAGKLLLLRDISERRRAEETRRRLDAQMLQSEKLESLGVLAGGIAHDFNNMFMIIHGSVELALLRTPQHDPIHGTLETVKETVEKAAELSRQMLAYAGKGYIDTVEVDLSELVTEMTPMVRVSVPDRVSIHYDLAADLPLVRADVAQMRQVVMTLVRNAAEAIGDAVGVITIQTSAAECDRETFTTCGVRDALSAGHYVILEVADNGPGMNADILPKIFDPFFSTKFLGRGLGLAAASGIVRSHNGAIAVESNPGVGAKFRVFLPA